MGGAYLWTRGGWLYLDRIDGGWSSQLVKPFAEVWRLLEKPVRNFKVSNGYNEWYVSVVNCLRQKLWLYTSMAIMQLTDLELYARIIASG